MSDPKTILVVEDEVLVSAIISLELEEAGYAVLSVSDGEAALEIIAGAAPVDLMFTDIKLAGTLNGWTVARKARDVRPALNIIYATGYAPDMPNLVEGARFFKKPYLPTAIIAAINEMLG
jgi:CheY-like chemotaxis protein